MIRRYVRQLVVLSCAATLGAVGAVAATAGPAIALPRVPAVSCTGSISDAVRPSAVTVTGSATCTGVATLSLTTTTNTGGVLSSVTSLLPALPNIPLPIRVTIPAAGVTSACSVLVNTGTGVTVASSCSA